MNRQFTLAAAALTAAVLALGFLNIGGKSFWATHAESRRADIAQNMIRSGDYLVPRVNGKTIFTKPPLYYWTLAAGFGIAGGASEGVARAPSALFGLGTAVLVFLIGSILFDRRTGLYSAAVLTTCYIFAFFMRFAELDMMFTFLITLSFYFLLRMIGDWDRRRAWSLAFWVAAGAAFMVKGPFAVLYPLAAYTALVYFTETDRWAKIRGVLNPWGIAAFVVITAPWFLYVMFYTNAAEVFHEEALERVGDSRGKPLRPFFYITSLTNFAPWLLIFPFALYRAVRDEARENGFALAWFLAGLAVASVISAKNHHYILPLYPALALLTGRFLAAHGAGALSGVMDRAAGIMGAIIAALPVVLFAALPFAHRFSGEVAPEGLMAAGAAGLLSAAFLGGAAYCLRKGVKDGVWAFVFASLFLTFTYAHAHYVPKLNTRNSHKEFLMEAKGIIDAGAQARMYRIENFQTSFYLEKDAPVIWVKEGLAAFHGKMKRTPERYYVITDERFVDEAVAVTGGEPVLRDRWYVPPRPSKKLRGFVLLKVQTE